jgi:probable F420-dependent oxidoreductase
MKLGVAMFPTDDSLPPGELARLVESAGFESLFFPEHSHIPSSRESHFDPDGGDLPPQYWHTYDLFVAMTMAVAATSTLNVGSGLCLVAQRDPIWTAKAVASLDQLSNGRLLFGVGAGWNREEMQSHGYDFRTRFSRMETHVQAMRALWTQEEARFTGAGVSFDGAWAWPKPRQRPHPPVLIGGAGPKVIDRVVAYGDAWLAEPADGLEDRVAQLMEAAAAAGRRGQVSVTIYGAEVEELDRWYLEGVDRCVFWVEPTDPDDVREQVRRLAAAVAADGSAD